MVDINLIKYILRHLVTRCSLTGKSASCSDTVRSGFIILLTHCKQTWRLQREILLDTGVNPLLRLIGVNLIMRLHHILQNFVSFKSKMWPAFLHYTVMALSEYGTGVWSRAIICHYVNVLELSCGYVVSCTSHTVVAFSGSYILLMPSWAGF